MKLSSILVAAPLAALTSVTPTQGVVDAARKAVSVFNVVAESGNQFNIKGNQAQFVVQRASRDSIPGTA